MCAGSRRRNPNGDLDTTTQPGRARLQRPRRVRTRSGRRGCGLGPARQPTERVLGSSAPAFMVASATGCDRAEPAKSSGPARRARRTWGCPRPGRMALRRQAVLARTRLGRSGGAVLGRQLLDAPCPSAGSGSRRGGHILSVADRTRWSPRTRRSQGTRDRLPRHARR